MASHRPSHGPALSRKTTAPALRTHEACRLLSVNPRINSSISSLHYTRHGCVSSRYCHLTYYTRTPLSLVCLTGDLRRVFYLPSQVPDRRSGGDFVLAPVTLCPQDRTGVSSTVHRPRMCLTAPDEAGNSVGSGTMGNREGHLLKSEQNEDWPPVY